MNIIYDLEKLEKPLINPVLTIGNFDGVHKGHLVLFNKVKERAKILHGQSAVMTFEPHPIRVMKPGNGPPLITPMKQKLDLMSETEMDVIFCVPFTLEFAAISARDFVEDILFKKIGPYHGTGSHQRPLGFEYIHPQTGPGRGPDPCGGLVGSVLPGMRDRHQRGKQGRKASGISDCQFEGRRRIDTKNGCIRRHRECGR
jgi:hypothetical protein